MKKTLFTGFSLWISLVVFAFSAETESKPLLWKVEKEGIKPSYLFGTFHLYDEKIIKMAEGGVVKKAFEQADGYRAEIDMSVTGQAKMMRQMFLPGEKTLYDILTEEQVKKVNAALGKANPLFTLEPFKKLEVWALHIMLPMLTMSMEQLGRPGVDQHLYNLAVREGKDVGGVETIEEHVAGLRNFTQEEQLKLLNDSLDYLEKTDGEGIKQEVTKLKNAYLEGDVKKLFQLMHKQAEETNLPNDGKLAKKFLEELLDKRNLRMTETIDKLLSTNKEKSYFIAIGAGHYAGETAIHKLLKKKGYTIERVQ